MNAEMLAGVLNWLPFAEVVWQGGDGQVNTVLCRVSPSQELNWEKLAEQWLRNLRSGRLLIAKQLMVRQGHLGYLWNVSLFSNDPGSAMEMMLGEAQRMFSEGPPGQAGQQGIPRQRGGTVTTGPQTLVDRTMRADRMSPETVISQKRQKQFYEIDVPLPGGEANRNIPRGVVPGAQGREVPSIKGAGYL
jgi:hypothetical protein